MELQLRTTCSFLQPAAFTAKSYLRQTAAESCRPLPAIEMKMLRPLIIIAVAANLLTVILYNYAASQPGGTGAALAFAVLWMPAIWLITIVLAIIIVLRRKKTLFGKSAWIWTVLILLCCTPIPIVLADQVIHPAPDTSRSSSFVKYENGKVYKEEYWYYTSNYRKKYVDMFFIADSLDEVANGDQAFKKDSTWIFFSKNGDTLRIEKYKDGKQLSVIQKSKEN